MIDLQIKFNGKQLRDFENIQTQLPFATAKAFTQTAKQAADRVQQELPRHFILRNQFTKNSIKTKRAEKSDWPNTYAVVGSISPYMEIQETGGEKVAGAKAFSIPKDIRTDERKLVSRSKWPGKILIGQGTIPMGGRNRGSVKGAKKKPTPFLLHEQNGVGVYVRVGNKKRLKRLFRLTRETLHVRARHWLEAPVTEVCTKNLQSNFVAALEDAMRTRI